MKVSEALTHGGGIPAQYLDIWDQETWCDGLKTRLQIQRPASSTDSEFSVIRSNQKPRLTSQNSYSKDSLCMHEMPSKDFSNAVIL